MRKYLDDLGVTDRPDTWNPDDKRQEKWQKERETYGFDERETWDLDYSFHLWLYERLKMLIKVPIDFEFHQFEYKGQTYTQKELIEMMVERLEFSFNENYNRFNKEQTAYVSEIEEIWAIVINSMWW